jgi:hypothetical protein
MAALSLVVAVSEIGTSPDAAGHPRAKRIPSRWTLNSLLVSIDRDTEQVANDNGIGSYTVGQIQRWLGCSHSVAGRIRDRSRPLRVREAATLARRAA